MTGIQSSEHNYFLSGAMPVLFLKTATPIVTVMAVNGLFTLIDAYFLGMFVGADALTAVTLVFPLYMLIVALSTLVSNGFSSIYARLLGAGDHDEAASAFGQATLLSLTVCALFALGFWITGTRLSLFVANGSQHLAGMGYTYISILIFCSPLMFLLALNIDALRCEGRLKIMAAITLSSSLLNIGFNYIFIAMLGLGVAGSAYGTLLAQLCSIIAILMFRARLANRPADAPTTWLNLMGLRPRTEKWGEILALGAPSSLGYIGISLSAGLTLYCLQLWASANYSDTAGAFGIITRLMTFSFLPLLGLSFAFQTIVGNNFGAHIEHRINSSVKIALAAAFFYCALLQTVFVSNRETLGYLFVDDPGVANEIIRILPYTVALMFVFGPLMMISTYFQAIGDAARAAILGLSRTYLFALPLTVLLPFVFGEWGIWYAGIAAEVLVLLLTFAVLGKRAAKHGYRWGLLEPPMR